MSGRKRFPDFVERDSDSSVQIEHGMSVHHGMRPCSTFFIDSDTPRGMYGKGGQLAALGRALAGGLSVRAAARRVGCHKNTANKLRRKLVALGHEFRCACGLLATHRGWCSHRYAQSPARQEIMRKLHGRRRSRESGEPT